MNTPPKTIAVKLSAPAERYVKKGHPWVYSDSIIKESKEPNTGDVAVIFDTKKNKYLALGLYDCDSPIRIKIIKAHTKIQLDSDYFLQELKDKLEDRRPLLQEDVTALRWINGENDHFPGLIIDVYNDTAVVKIYSLTWMPYLDQIVAALPLCYALETIILRSARNIADELARRYDLRDGSILYGSLQTPIITFREYGVRFSADLVSGHKTGYFLDHRHNRHKVGLMAKDKTVLDVFSYAGGFSVHALVGGAKEVTSIDISKQALDMATANAELNTSSGKHLTIARDAFEAMDDLISKGKTYDIVVVDPPSFAKQSKEIERAISSYDRLAKYAVQLVAPRGMLVMASCSSRVDKETFFATVESVVLSSSAFSLIEKTYHDIDHPVTFPEGAYLKTGYYRKLV